MAKSLNFVNFLLKLPTSDPASSKSDVMLGSSALLIKVYFSKPFMRATYGCVSKSQTYKHSLGCNSKYSI